MSHRPGPRSPRPPSAGRSRPRASARRRTASPTARSGAPRTGGVRTGSPRPGGARTGAPRTGRRPPGPGAAGPAGRRPAPRRPILLNPFVVTLVSFVVTVLVCFIVASRMGDGGEADARAVWTEMGPAPVVLDTEGFDPAHLIDDDVFYDSTAMTLAEITAFIARVNAGCRSGSDGTPCLAEATFASVDREPTDMCPGGYTGAKEESAAQVISKVATACDINPQVLLVLIQKEQGLLTASGRNLTARRYEAAAGYACPDTSQCDRKWEGFFLQLYGAASQFQRYRLNPGSYDVVAQTPTRIAYSPDQTCGDAELTIVNQATAGLYNYTPYQPDDAVKSGGKDECSSWGNWNFYGYFRAFFDDPTPSTAA